MKYGETKLITSLLTQQKSFCIASALAPDWPIVYASHGFAALSGYDVQQTLGKSCLFLQGSETDHNQVKRLTEALRSHQEVQVILKNYRKNGTTFWNLMQLAPMKDLQGLMTLIVGVHVEVSKVN